MVRHLESRLSRAIKLAKVSFVWVVSATPLMNKTTDFFGYCHLLYDEEWSLNLRDEWLKKPTLLRFRDAIGDELLELFNPTVLKSLSENGHISPDVAAATIPVLLGQCQIRRTRGTIIEGSEAIGKRMPEKQLRSVVLALSRAEQEQYCSEHLILTEDISSKTKSGGRMNAGAVTDLLCASFCPRFLTFQSRIGDKSTRANQLKDAINNPFYGCEFFLKISHPAFDYQYHVSSTRVNRAIEFLNISPVLRYLMIRLYRIINLQNERVVLVGMTSVNCWLTCMFCTTIGWPTAWLKAGATNQKREEIIEDFNKPKTHGKLKILVTTDRVGGFGLNLEQGGCYYEYHRTYSRTASRF